jgi:pimeloyl-ACP methyl ester carboxylesterase
MTDSRTITVGDVQLSYRDTGKGSVLVFLHAFPLNQSMWDDQLAEFSADHRVITLDWRGFGRSSLGSRESRMEVFADDLNGLLDALDIEKAAICGLSMGGYATLAFMRTHPERASSLIFADTRAGSDTEEARANRTRMAAKAREKGASSIIEDMLPKLLGKTSLESRPAIAARVRSMIEPTNPEAIARALEGMSARPNSLPLLPSIKCPTLVIVGSEDELTPPAESKQLAAGIKGSTLEIIDSAGHLSNVEAPAEFNRVARRFLETVEKR